MILRFGPRTRKIASTTVAGALLWAAAAPLPAPVLPAAHAARSKKKDPTRRQLRALLAEGKKAYLAGDVFRAKDLWSRVVELAKTSTRYRDEMLAAIVNLAEANYQIYLATRDFDKLVHARDLFEYFVVQKSSEKKLSAKEEQLLVKLQIKIAELNAKIAAEKERRRRRASGYDRMSQRATYRAAFEADPDRQRGKAMMGFGGFLAGAGFVTFTAGPAIGAAAGNVNAVIGTAVAGVLAGVVGAAVLGAGVATWKRARYRARRKAGLALSGVGGTCLPAGPAGLACTMGLRGAF